MENTWQDIWQSNVNGTVAQSVAQKHLQSLGTVFRDDGTDRAKFIVDIQLSSVFQMNSKDEVERNEPVIALARLLQLSGRDIRTFSPLTKVMPNSPLIKAVKKMGWRHEFGNIRLMEEFEDRTFKIGGQAPKRLAELLIMSGSGMDIEEIETAKRAHVSDFTPTQIAKWAPRTK